MEEDGLGVVVGVVGSGQLLGPQFLGGLGEEAVPHGPGGLLHPFALLLGLLGHVPLAHDEGDVPLLAPLGDEGLVPLGLLPPQLVVEVGGVEVEVPFLGQLLQHGEQGHGVSPAGEGHQDGGAGGEHVVLVGKGRRLGDQINRVLHSYAPGKRRQ